MGANQFVPLIRNGFRGEKQKDGNTCYDNVREIAFYGNQLFGNLGEFITETKYDSNNHFLNDRTNGVYIYQSRLDPTVGYRLYKTFADYGFNGHMDEILIQKLLEKQDKIQMTAFPTGVITLDDRIIGQEIPFYGEDVTLLDYAVQYCSTPEDLFEIYVGVLDALKEMADNGVFYLDVHARNFMINPQCSSSQIHTIDFDYSRMVFDDVTVSEQQTLFANYSDMIKCLNERVLKRDVLIAEYPAVGSFDEAYRGIHDMAQKTKQKKLGDF